MLHKFHFKIDVEMRDALKKLESDKESRSFSALLVGILRQLYPVIKKRHFFGSNHFSCYRFVHDDLEIDRVSIFIWIPEWLYRRLKLIHHDLNLFSMAQMIRDMLWLFLDLTGTFGCDLQSILNLLCDECRDQCEKIPCRREIMYQLFPLQLLECMKPEFFTFYSPGFEPMAHFRC